MTAPTAPRWSRVALVACRIGVALVFMVAGAVKIGAAADLAHTVAGYRLLPPFGARMVALVLPWVEIVAGACLLAGFMTASAALVATLLAVAFEVAVVSALLRGLVIACGCFHDHSSVSWTHAGLDLALVAAAVAVLVGSWRRDRDMDRGGTDRESGH